MIQLLWPSFWSGNLALNQSSMLAPFDADTDDAPGAFNLGQLMGLHGLASLLPLLAVWALAGMVWVKTKECGEKRMQVSEQVRK
jgi:hypothetical protein